MNKMFDAFKVKAPKNQYRLQRFLQVISEFATPVEEGDDVGLRWFFKTHFIQRAGDFILGKKSPLWKEEDNR